MGERVSVSSGPATTLPCPVPGLQQLHSKHPYWHKAQEAGRCAEDPRMQGRRPGVQARLGSSQVKDQGVTTQGSARLLSKLSRLIDLHLPCGISRARFRAWS